MDVETVSLTLLNLPGEIQNKIVGELEPFELLLLRVTCRHFRNIIPPLKMSELLVAESSTTGIERDLYACCLYLRLRQALHFADNMKKKQKRKSAGGGYSRFCVQCGLAPPKGKPGYGRGTYITKDGVVSVVCLGCIRLKRPAPDATGKNTQYYIGCWAGTREGQEMLRQEQVQLQQERLRRETERVIARTTTQGAEGHVGF